MDDNYNVDNELMFSFNINSNARQQKAKLETVKINKEENGNSSDDFNEKLLKESSKYEDQYLNKSSKNTKIKKNEKVKSLSKVASQKYFAQCTKSDDIVKKCLKRNNSLDFKILPLKTTRSKFPKDDEVKKPLNNKVSIAKTNQIQCKTQENSKSNNENCLAKAVSNNKKINSKGGNNIASNKTKIKVPTNSNKNLKKSNQDNVSSKQSVNSNNSSSNALIKELQNQIKQLKEENQNLKGTIEEERIMNLKFKDFAQDLIKFYEKSNVNGISKKDSSPKKRTKNPSYIKQAEEDF